MTSTDNVRAAPPLGLLDPMLVQHAPFGDSDYIRKQMQEAFRRRLIKVAEKWPSAGDLAEALLATSSSASRRVYGDPVVRAAIQHAFTQLMTKAAYGFDPTECDLIFREALAHLQRGLSEGPLQTGLDRLGPDPYHGFTWCDDGSDQVFPRSFRRLVEDNFGSPAGSINRTDLRAIQRGLELMAEVLPAVSRSALSHVEIVSAFPSTGSWQGRASCSQYRMVGTVFLQHKSLQDPWWVAEHLLHEALHQKVYDFRHGHSLYSSDSLPDMDNILPERRIRSIWNVEDGNLSSHWGVSRAVVACHVYAHLALFGMIVDDRADDLEAAFGPRPKSLTSSRAARGRALYLAAAIRTHAWNELGPAGQSFIEWLEQFLALLGTAPSPEGLYLELALQRYWRECATFDELQSQAQPDLDAVTESISGLADQELQAAQSALKLIQADGELARLEDYRLRLNPKGVIDILDVRAVINSVISDSGLIDGLVGAHVLAAQQSLTAVIEHSSVQLSALLQKTAIDGQKAFPAEDTSSSLQHKGDERALLLRLTDVLGQGYGTEDFCLFLYTLVRMQAPTRMVELGTGRAASAFWMALAARRNGNGHVWTYDDQERLGEVGDALSKNVSTLKGTPWEVLNPQKPAESLQQVARMLHLEPHLTMTRARLRPEVKGNFDLCGLPDQIDLAFSDFQHGPTAILQIVGQLLPKMAPASSIFVDSASTYWPSYLLLENMVNQFNCGRVPAMLQATTDVDLEPILRSRRTQLIHLTKANAGSQNSVAWLKFEPYDVVPHPLSTMRK